MSACHKKKYTSWKHASNDARSLRLKGWRKEEPYHCKSCKAWHVGGRLKPVRKPEPERRRRSIWDEVRDMAV